MPNSSNSTLSLSLPVGYGIPPSELVRVIQRADRSGLAGVGVGELASTDAVALLAAAAPSTEQIRLETSVLSVLTRSPALFAMTAATLAQLSGGRFALGLGAGSPIVAGFHGLPFERPLARVERWITDVRNALAGGTLDDWGSFRLRGIDPAPVPLLLAAMNTGMIELAGRAADGVIFNFCGPDQVRALSATARMARPAGANSEFEVHTTLWADASGDAEHARERFRSEMAPYLAVPTYRSAVVALSDEDAIDRATAAWAANGRKAAAELFPDSIVDAVLATDADDLASKAAALAEAGCTGVRVTPLTHELGNATHAMAVIDLIAEVAERTGAR